MNGEKAANPASTPPASSIRLARIAQPPERNRGQFDGALHCASISSYERAIRLVTTLSFKWMSSKFPISRSGLASIHRMTASRQSGFAYAMPLGQDKPWRADTRGCGGEERSDIAVWHRQQFVVLAELRFNRRGLGTIGLIESQDHAIAVARKRLLSRPAAQWGTGSPRNSLSG